MEVQRQELPQLSDWAGTVGVGIASNNVEYFDEPALAVMLCDLPREQYRVFSGVAPLSNSANFKPRSALVYADGRTPDLGDLLGELAGRTASGYLFDGLSGVAFSESVALISRVTQGCQPIRLPKGHASEGKAAKAHRITKSEGHVALELDGEPALDVLLDELGITLSDPQRAVVSLKQTFMGLTKGSNDSSLAQSQGRFGADTRVRHLVGLDPLRRGIAEADVAPEGSELTFWEHKEEAARRDLMRICAEIREELEPEEIMASAGAIY
jgi:small ligand-binding sensory domain FIST